MEYDPPAYRCGVTSWASTVDLGPVRDLMWKQRLAGLVEPVSHFHYIAFYTIQSIQSSAM